MTWTDDVAARRKPRLLFLLALACVVSLLTWPAATARGNELAKVDPEVLSQLSAQRTITFWAVLGERADLARAAAIADRIERTRAVVAALQATAEGSQAGLRRMLEARKAGYEAYWIVNAVLVSGDETILRAVAARSDVAGIEATQEHLLIEPTIAEALQSLSSVEWGVERINAPSVWGLGYTGTGIVVANIDTGVAHTHPALVSQYRGNLGAGRFSHDFNWYDPTDTCASAPCDNHNHGTHTMGTVVGSDGGSNRIGVAPGAKWIGVKGCKTGSCADSALLKSAQWVLAPCPIGVAPGSASCDASKRPDIVNNSWGKGSGNFWYAASVDAWVAAGIFPVFAIGNNGSSCATGISPGDYAQSYAVGAFNSSNNIASFSSRGPASTGIVKPNIAAPGVSIRSAVASPANSYEAKSGTSMAAPHVAGAIALLWNAVPSLRNDIATTRGVLDLTAIDRNNISCGGTRDLNNVWGEGMLDALAAVETAAAGVGALQGVVRDGATGAAIAGATVETAGPGARTTITDGSGQYSFPALPVGSYEVTASGAIHAAQSSQASISAGNGATLDFALLQDCQYATVFAEDFDGVSPPTLPTGWRVNNALGPEPPWTTSNDGKPAPVSDSGPNSAFIDSPAEVSDKRLISPSLAITSPVARLAFRQRVNVERNFDGGVLEISIDFGSYSDIVAAGGSFTAGGYNGTISTAHSSPIGGRAAWTGSIGTTSTFVTVAVDLPAAAAGKGIRLRWRMATDSSVGGVGWRIDTISVSDCLPVSSAADPTASPAPTASPTPSPAPTASLTPSPAPTASPTPTAPPTPTATPVPVSARITPANASCAQLAGGTVTTVNEVLYTIKPNGTIHQTNPTGFAYWVQVAAPAGSTTVAVEQQITTGNFATLFRLGNGSSVYTADCSNGISASFSQTSVDAASGTVIVRFTAPSDGWYYVALAFSNGSVRNKTAPQPPAVRYEFSTAGATSSQAGFDFRR